jgi:hypothetical protein
MSAESERVAGFGRLEDGLLQGGDWYRWGCAQTCQADQATGSSTALQSTDAKD